MVVLGGWRGWHGRFVELRHFWKSQASIFITLILLRKDNVPNEENLNCEIFSWSSGDDGSHGREIGIVK